MNSSVMVVLSGGQDSTTCLLEARRQYKTVHTITFNYGQRHSIEIEQAAEVAKIVGVQSHAVVNVAGLLKGRSPLVNPNAQLETYTDYSSMDATIGDRVELTFVPLRNPFFLLVATNHALALDTYDVMTGVCAMDNANYPDCTRVFLQYTQSMINNALGFDRQDYRGRRVQLCAPLLDLSKADTVRLAMSHGDLGRRALAASHTCYAGERPPCGECHACVLRAHGFAAAGVPDPLVEATRG
jgi:7-cyano-7-deazaguanine synthase